MIACLFGASCQSSLKSIRSPLPLCSSRVGFWSTPVSPRSTSDGPIARIATVFGVVPKMINPPMSASWFEPTFTRVEMFARCAGFATTVTLKVWVTLPPSTSVPVTVIVAVPRAFGVTSRFLSLTETEAMPGCALEAVKVSGTVSTMLGIVTEFSGAAGVPASKSAEV